MDIFDMFFGGGMRGGHRERERRGRDMVHPLKVSLEELYNGATRQLALNKNVICSKCNGKGSSEYKYNFVVSSYFCGSDICINGRYIG